MINGKIYVGVHKTKNMGDGYMGSGKLITAAIKKYGEENFTKTIMQSFDNSEDMFRVEKEVVTGEFIARIDTYNLRRGGHGGFDFINMNKLNNRSGFEHSLESRAKMGRPQPEAKRKIQSERMLGDLNVMKNPAVSEKVAKSLTGKNKSEDHKRKISESVKRRYAEKIVGIA